VIEDSRENDQRASDGAALLASVHDISPLTLSACQQAVTLLRDAAGLTAQHLTLLAIPFHEGKTRLDDDRATTDWLKSMADAGATLVLHGLTHRMPRPSYNPAHLLTGYGFARGQGELLCLDAGDTQRRLDEGRDILRRAGLGQATTCFIPPAWLLSSAGRRAVEAAGFDWIELYDGLHGPAGRRPLRLIGWGSLNPVEAAATTAFAFLQRQRPSVDTRLVVHPADMTRAGVRRSIETTARALRERLTPLSYRTYLEQKPLRPSA
jgi:predicted deacetylase